MKLAKLTTRFIRMAISAFVVLSISCDKPNLDGHWHVFYAKGNYPTEYYWDIRNDSLFLNDNLLKLGADSFDLSRNHIKIKWTDEEENFRYQNYGDTCLLYKNDTLELILRKKYNCKIYEHWVTLIINLNPPIFSENDIATFTNNDSAIIRNAFIYIGLPKDSSKNKFIQLNDKLADVYDVVYWLNYVPQLIFIVDKNIKMKFIDELLLELRYYQTQKIGYAFDIKGDNNKLGILFKPLYGIANDLKYYPSNHKVEIREIPPPPPTENMVLKNTKGFTFNLKDNALYFSKKKVDYDKLKDSLENYFNSYLERKTPVTVIFEWDTASIFETYAKVSNILNNARQNYRIQATKVKWNRDYRELSKEEKNEIKKEYPVSLLEISPADRYAINKKASGIH